MYRTDSGVSRVGQAWLMSWSPLDGGAKVATICSLLFLQPLFCAPYNHYLHQARSQVLRFGGAK